MAVVLVAEVAIVPFPAPLRQPVCPGIPLWITAGVADEESALGGAEVWPLPVSLCNAMAQAAGNCVLQAVMDGPQQSKKKARR
jgi:hypothetical protein